MKVILLKNVPGLGSVGEVKDVAPGYARNVLFKNQQARLATEENINRLQAEEARLLKTQAEQKAELGKLQQKLNSLKLTIKEKANKQGKLFAGIDEKRIARILKEDHGVEISAKSLHLNEHIKELGVKKISYSLGNNQTGEFSLEVKNS